MRAFAIVIGMVVALARLGETATHAFSISGLVAEADIAPPVRPPIQGLSVYGFSLQYNAGSVAGSTTCFGTANGPGAVLATTKWINCTDTTAAFKYERVFVRNKPAGELYIKLTSDDRKVLLTGHTEFSSSKFANRTIATFPAEEYIGPQSFSFDGSTTATVPA